MLEQIKDNLFRINKNQYLKINKKGNGEIVAPAKDPVTKKLNWNNIIFTGGTAWGLVKVILIVFLLVFLLWRYEVEVGDCIELRRSVNPRTGCIENSYFQDYNINLKEEDNGQIRLSLPLPAEGDNKPLK